jgi:hypothetical protein
MMIRHIYDNLKKQRSKRNSRPEAKVGQDREYRDYSEDGGSS